MKDGSFVYIPIPDDRRLDHRTYGNTKANGKPLASFFPERKQQVMFGTPIHFDPEFKTYTYGDPTSPKAGLRRLEPQDILVFYCGLKGWDCLRDPALYVIGFFVVEFAGYARDFSTAMLKKSFGNNWHVINARSLQRLRRPDEPLVLVKGSTIQSRLLKRAHCISEMGNDRDGKPLKIVSKKMRKVFGNFGEHVSLQRSPPRWITTEPCVSRTGRWLHSLLVERGEETKWRWRVTRWRLSDRVAGGRAVREM